MKLLFYLAEKNDALRKASHENDDAQTLFLLGEKLGENLIIPIIPFDCHTFARDHQPLLRVLAVSANTYHFSRRRESGYF